MLKNNLSSAVLLCIKHLSPNELLTVIGESPLLKVFQNHFSAQRGGFCFQVNQELTRHQKASPSNVFT